MYIIMSHYEYLYTLLTQCVRVLHVHCQVTSQAVQGIGGKGGNMYIIMSHYDMMCPCVTCTLYLH